MSRDDLVVSPRRTGVDGAKIMWYGTPALGHRFQYRARPTLGEWLRDLAYARLQLTGECESHCSSPGWTGLSYCFVLDVAIEGKLPRIENSPVNDLDDGEEFLLF